MCLKQGYREEETYQHSVSDWHIAGDLESWMLRNMETKYSGVIKNEGSRGNRGIMNWALWRQWDRGIAFGTNQKKRNLPCELNTLGNERDK